MNMRSLARIFFVVVLLVVGAFMAMPAHMLLLLRHHGWIDATANLLLSVMPGVDLDPVVAFGALAMAARLAFPRASARYCIPLLAVVAALTEVVQIWSPGREPAIHHFLLNVIGVLAGFGLASVVWIAFAPEGRAAE